MEANKKVSQYDGECIGRYRKEYAYNAQFFNSKILQGMEISDIMEEERKRILRRRVHIHFVYEYEVNGTKYIKACEKATIRKDGLIAIAEKQGKEYIVRYDTLNPWNSYIGEMGDAEPGAEKLALCAMISGIVSMVLSITVVGKNIPLNDHIRLR